MPTIKPLQPNPNSQMPKPEPLKIPAMLQSNNAPTPKAAGSQGTPGSAPKPILLAQSPGSTLPIMPNPMALNRIGSQGTAPAPKPLTGAGPGHGVEHGPAPVAIGGPAMTGQPAPASASAATHARNGNDAPDGMPQPTKAVGRGPSSAADNLLAARPNVGPRKSGRNADDAEGSKGANRGTDETEGPDVDFSKYMASLQRRIKSRWYPTKIQNSNRVQVTFKISLDGELSGLKIERSSGIASVDQAALKAVQDAAPFPPLPPGSAKSSVAEGGKVSIQFTFDYNVFDYNGHGKMLNY
jgi:protein TonB